MKPACYLLLPMVGLAPVAMAADRPIVLELYTSQGCSSCPPADALLKQLAADPRALALSFHVHYWDYLGWKDPFASSENTNRQRAYLPVVHESNMFTPQLIIDGAYSVVGSNARAVKEALAKAQESVSAVPIGITPSADGLVVKVEGSKTQQDATLWQIMYDRGASTKVEAGENRGRVMDSVHNVVSITRLDSWQQSEKIYKIKQGDIGDHGVAILLQEHALGRMLGAAAYDKGV